MKIDGHKVITMSGSTRFKKEYLETAMKLYLDEYVPLFSPVFSKADNIELTDDEEKYLDERHKGYLRVADILYVVDPGGYIGESTKNEILYFKEIHPDGQIRYYSQENQIKTGD